MSKLLEGKVAIITGAGDGIGRATAEIFVADGASVVVAERDTTSGMAVADAINQAGGKALFVETDVTQVDQVQAMVEATLSQFGRLDAAVNNAARSTSFAMLNETQVEELDRTFDVTMKGVFHCMKAELNAMLDQGSGAIVNIASLSGVRGEVLQTPYSAAKAAVIGMTKTAAAEYAQKGIRVNAICPGGIATAGMQMYFDKAPGAKETVEGVHAMRRLGKPEEIADAAAFLCSDRSSFITGHPLVVDGGVMVNPHLF